MKRDRKGKKGFEDENSASFLANLTLSQVMSLAGFAGGINFPEPNKKQDKLG